MSDAAELSSIQSSLEELADRIDSIAKRRDAGDEDPIAPQLFEVDRSIRQGLRQLDRLRTQL